MTGVAARFFTSAVLYAILGMMLGLHMGISQNHTQMPTHAHLLLIGWVTFALFGFFYHLFPERAASNLAVIHFWLAEASFVALIIALYLLFGGNASADPLAAAGSIGFLLSMILFGVIAWPVVRRAR